MALKDVLTTDNFKVLLNAFECPACFRQGAFDSEYSPNNNGYRLVCKCGLKDPLRAKGITWLRHDKNASKRTKAPLSINKLLAIRGNHCWGCGATPEELTPFGIGWERHHTQPYAEVQHDTEFIPLCSVCHQAVTMAQRFIQRILLKKRHGHQPSGMGTVIPGTGNAPNTLPSETEDPNGAVA